jgi:hypothetical protein
MHNGDASSSSDDEWPFDTDQSRPSTPVPFDNRDINLNKDSPLPCTQAQYQVIRYLNVRVLPRCASLNLLRIPTTLDLQTNVDKVYQLTRQRSCGLQPVATPSTRSRNILSSAELSDDQRTVMPQMQYHVLCDVLWVNPWPELEERAMFLSDVQRYAANLTKITTDEVFTPKFLDTMSADIGCTLVFFTNCLL